MARKMSNDELYKLLRQMSNDELYKLLRQDAFDLREKAKTLFREAQDAQRCRNHELCKKLKKQAHSKLTEAQQWQKVAAEIIFNITNAKNNKFVIDLHGLHTSEAVGYVSQRLVQLNESNDTAQPLLVITGRGIHSRLGPKLPTAIKDFCDENGYYYKEGKPGTILVYITTRFSKSLKSHFEEYEEPLELKWVF
ncbi:endonuclease NBR9-like [Carex rostrata]